MQQCLICDSSLQFSRAIYGALALIAFLIQSHWLVLIISFLMIFGSFSIKFNIPYQFYALVLKKILKNKIKLIRKESKELNFACGMGGSILFIGFLLLHFESFIGFAWILILIMSLFMFLASFVGVCVASLMYAFLKKLFKKLKNEKR